MPAGSSAYDTLLPLLTPVNRHRTSSEISDGLKRIRRLVLTEGIPEPVSRIQSASDLSLIFFCNVSDLVKVIVVVKS